MLTVYPDYYKEFRCIKEKCLHNCCIGWEIDIDPFTLSLYEGIEGKMGERLKGSISHEGDPHFILGECERCPFLNQNNLCDIIINLGEGFLCDICDNHPRFINEIGDRTEIGIGLCCEAAGRLILGRQSPSGLIFEGEGGGEKSEITALRDRAISCLQDRSLGFWDRIGRMLEFFGRELEAADWSKISDKLLSLERLDEQWTQRINSLKAGADSADFEGFNEAMRGRMHEYEQLAVYFVYRHMPSASDFAEASDFAALTLLCCRIIYAMGAVRFGESGSFPFEEQIELCRMFSSEIEYSDQNLSELLEFASAE